MNEEQAKIVALRALAYLVGDEDALQRFMDLSGIDSTELRAGADDPAMLGGVLDYFLGNETELLEMCTATDMAGEEPGRARHSLAGNKYDEWS
ncbi:MAG: DUF3572 domain-containing protein [Alphaproteobacteria bacterium]|nr:DUF3572 domain-containing protein [Alphaproteobacteria bacterium]